MYRRDKKRLEDRQMDTLVGLSKGIIADGVVNQKEAKFLLNWLQTSKVGETENPYINALVERISEMLDDGLLDNEEAEELFEALKTFTGEIPEESEVMKPSLPLSDPPPQVVFENRIFVFTGTFIYGPRARCKEAVESKKGETSSSLTQKVDYLVIGSYVTSSWKHESYGNKIEKAIRYREKHGSRPAIICEDHFVQAL